MTQQQERGLIGQDLGAEFPLVGPPHFGTTLTPAHWTLCCTHGSCTVSFPPGVDGLSVRHGVACTTLALSHLLSCTAQSQRRSRTVCSRTHPFDGGTSGTAAPVPNLHPIRTGPLVCWSGRHTCCRQQRRKADNHHLTLFQSKQLSRRRCPCPAAILWPRHGEPWQHLLPQFSPSGGHHSCRRAGLGIRESWVFTSGSSMFGKVCDAHHVTHNLGHVGVDDRCCSARVVW